MEDLTEQGLKFQISQMVSQNSLSVRQIAIRNNIHPQTLTLWLQGKISGLNLGLKQSLRNWLFINEKSSQKPLPQSQDVIVPFHFDFQSEGKRYKEQFCLNITNSFYTPQQFAKMFIAQNPSLLHFEGKIRESIKKAISIHLSKPTVKSPCLRVLELDVKVENVSLRDKFEWDINDRESNPEDFALLLVQELGLSAEFIVKISHQIREQIQYYRKEENSKKEEFAALLDIKKSTRNLISLSGIEKYAEEEISHNNFIRRQDTGWEPVIEVLDFGDANHKYQERQNRYMRRTR